MKFERDMKKGNPNPLHVKNNIGSTTYHMQNSTLSLKL